MKLGEAALDLYMPSTQRHVVERLVEAASRLPLNPVKLRPPVFRGGLPEPASCITGVDGGHQVLELCGGSLIMAAAVAYTAPLTLIEDKEPLIEAEVLLTEADDPAAVAEAVERRLTYRAAFKALLHRGSEALLIDGGLLPHPHLYQAGRDELASCVVEEARLLALAEAKGVDVAGVVKRSRGRLFDGVHRDTALLDLREGEATEPRPVEENWLKRLREAAKSMGLDLPEVYVSYVKTTQHREPLRVEVPSWARLNKLLSTILATADPLTGVPVHVAKADSHTKVHAGVVRAVYSRLLYRLVEEHGEAAEDYLRLVRGERAWEE